MMSEVTQHDLHVLLVEIRGELRAARVDIAAHLKDDEKTHARLEATAADHEMRLRANDKFRWGIAAVLAVTTALGSWGIFA
jgi:hypothetical protein